MTVKQYQEIHKLDEGSDTYEVDICKVLNINIARPIDEVRKDLKDIMVIETSNVVGSYKLNGRVYKVESDLLESTYEQFVELDKILAEDDNIGNLHKLISIYFRPTRFNIFKMKRVPITFNLKEQDKIYNEIQEHLDIKVANSVILFFYQIATKSLRHINISYLNLMKEKNMSIQSK